MAGDTRKPTEHFDDDLDVERRVRVHKPRRFKVLLHNDNYTTMEFVVQVLLKFFNKDPTEAEHIMLTVHHKGHDHMWESPAWPEGGAILIKSMKLSPSTDTVIHEKPSGCWENFG